jgi:chromosome segregation ATPase
MRLPLPAKSQAVSSPSSYLEASLSRLNDRVSLIRRDVELMLEGLHVKGRFLDELRENVRRHREEDFAQLREARRETWASWDERLKRVEEWMGAAAGLHRSATTLRAWRDSSLGFDRALTLSQKYAATLEQKAKKVEEKLVVLAERMHDWTKRLSAMEAELREFVERQAVKSTEILVSKARKRPYLEFVFNEREEEGRISLELKKLRTTANRVLERIARAEKWAAERAEANPDHFEARRTSLVESWRPFHGRFTSLREAALHQALDFEEGRRRLRWIYEQVQRMRVVEESVPQRRPLLQRLFKSKEES